MSIQLASTTNLPQTIYFNSNADCAFLAKPQTSYSPELYMHMDVYHVTQCSLSYSSVSILSVHFHVNNKFSFKRMIVNDTNDLLNKTKKEKEEEEITIWKNHYKSYCFHGKKKPWS